MLEAVITVPNFLEVLFCKIEKIILALRTQQSFQMYMFSIIRFN